MLRRCLAIALFAAVTGFVFAQDVPLTNWTVPPYHAASASGGLTTMTDVSPGVGFVAIQPCRVADTRGNGAPITGGIFANSEARTWQITGKCGIPAGTDAVSANFSVVSPAGTPTGAFLLAWPTGQPAPPTAIMTYGPGVTVISNAAVVPLNAAGQMTVNVSHSTHVILDVNGYFTDQYNPGVSFHAVSSNAAPAILAENTSTASEAVAVRAVITTTTPGPTGVAAVQGFNQGTNATGVGVWGKHNGGGWGVLGESATGFGVVATAGGNGPNAAVYASNSSTGGSGVYGQNTATSGATYGGNFRAESNTNGSAGVLGVSRVRPVFSNLSLANFPVGVRGEGSNGVQGIGVFLGVGGAIAQNGSVLAAGEVGFQSGSTNYGVFSEGPYGGTGAKYFVEPHPEDASKVIRYVSLEGNEAGTYFRGRARFENGIATIDVPQDFRLVTDSEGLSIQVTPIGHMATVAVESIGLDRIVVRGSRNVEFFYTVNGVRRTHKHLRPIGPGIEYMPASAESKMPLWLTDGQKEMLISNGTYKPDGTVNMETVRRLGWDKEWEKRGRPAPQPTSD